MKRSFAIKFERAGWRQGQEEVWSQAPRSRLLQEWSSLSTSVRGECLHKGKKEGSCSNLQRFCFNFFLKGWQVFHYLNIWPNYFIYWSFGILLTSGNKYGLNTRAVMKSTDFLVKLSVVCILVIIQQMDSTCCASPSTYRWDWNISWIYILFGLTKPGFEFEEQQRN